MNIGIFGGSFDPIHIEHIRMAKSAIDTLCLDKLIIMPASTPPHKQGKRLSPAAARLHACTLAFENEPKVEVSDYEIEKQGTSYTYLTCRHFRALYPEANLFWLVGTDMLRDFPTWKNPEDILSNATLAVCSRAEKEGWEEKELALFREKFHKEVAVIRYVASAVSSTQIRVLSGAGMRITHLMDEKVAQFIEKEGLYKISNADKALSLQNEKRAKHSLGVALAAATVANKLKMDERQAITAALFHDCAKNITAEHPLLKGFVLDEKYGEVPPDVWHQFAGAYLAETAFKVTDEEVLNAIRFHTSGRANMTALEKLIFLADMVEESRTFDGVDEIRKQFYQGNLDEAMRLALKKSLSFLKEKGASVYPLTLEAYKSYE